ncbi:hypothetical protein [Verrucomicrobium spinosum]|uniref:hypothetical protein n=1 Tax=Verrucomicrobium spinosum TaxID=2736 RepID=UPI0012E262BF|nr:hypothetical protein [Verrucomicrobium spinosum]
MMGETASKTEPAVDFPSSLQVLAGGSGNPLMAMKMMRLGILNWCCGGGRWRAAR